MGRMDELPALLHVAPLSNARTCGRAVHVTGLLLLQVDGGGYEKTASSYYQPW